MTNSIAALVVELDSPRITPWGRTISRFIVHQTVRGIMVQYGHDGFDMWATGTDMADLDRYYAWNVYAKPENAFTNPQTGEISLWTDSGQLETIGMIFEEVEWELGMHYRDHTIPATPVVRELKADPDLPWWELDLLT